MTELPQNTPAGHFALALDGFIRQYAQPRPELDATTMCATLLQVAAAIGVEAGGDAEGFSAAAWTFFSRELEARAKKGDGA